MPLCDMGIFVDEAAVLTRPLMTDRRRQRAGTGAVWTAELVRQHDFLDQPASASAS